MFRSNAVVRAALSLSALSLSMFVSFIQATPASAGCRSCDMFMRCVTTPMGALVCVEGPISCTMALQCTGGGGAGRIPDSPAEELTTWSVFDVVPGTRASRATLRLNAGALSLGDEAQQPWLPGRGVLADAALAYGREYDVTLADASGEGFALKRSLEAGRVRLEVRAVRGEVPAEVLASELLGERDELTVPVRIEGRDRMLVMHTSSLAPGLAAGEITRLRRGLASAARVLPRRQQPLLRIVSR